LVLAVEFGRRASLSSIFLPVAAIAFASWLCARERRKEAPLLPIDLLALRPFRASATASVFFFTAQSAGLLALPFYIQLSLGRSATSAGLVFMLWPLAVASVSPIASRMAERLTSATLCTAGALLMSAGLAGTALWPVEGSIAPLAACALISGVGFGLFQVPNNRTMFLTAPPARSAAAGGLQGTARVTGQTAGALLVTFVLSAAPIDYAPPLACGLAAAAALVAAWISRPQNVTAPSRPASSLGSHSLASN